MTTLMEQIGDNMKNKCVICSDCKKELFCGDDVYYSFDLFPDQDKNIYCEECAKKYKNIDAFDTLDLDIIDQFMNI